MRNAFVLLALSASLSLQAKVVFTGYADFRAIPQATTTLDAADSTLRRLKVTQTETTTRSFGWDALGLFASTSFNDQVDFLVDFTYRRIGTKVEETRIQYAYLDYRPWPSWELKLGKITLPIGLYNENYFYPFLRPTITPPIYQSAILGLPIADLGGLIGKTFAWPAMDLSLKLFGVNGFGPSKASGTMFRAGIGVGDGLVLANNVTATNGNEEFSYGGNLGVSLLADRALTLGVSGYWGPWSRDGAHTFSMGNAYLQWSGKRFRFLVEGLRTQTESDQGVVGYFGSQDWGTQGAFTEGGLVVWQREQEDVTFFLGAEIDRGEGEGPGASGREKVKQAHVGLTWKHGDFLWLKGEFNALQYVIPLQEGGSVSDLDIQARQINFSLVVTY